MPVGICRFLVEAQKRTCGPLGFAASCGTQNRFFGLERRAILTAAPLSPRFIVHRTRFGDNAQSRSALLAETKKQQPFGHCSNLVEATGFEPAALCSQSRCATKLRYASILNYMFILVLCSFFFGRLPKQIYSCGSQSFFVPWSGTETLTATPFRPPFFRHWRRSGSMLPNCATPRY